MDQPNEPEASPPHPAEAHDTAVVKDYPSKEQKPDSKNARRGFFSLVAKKDKDIDRESALREAHIRVAIILAGVTIASMFINLIILCISQYGAARSAESVKMLANTTTDLGRTIIGAIDGPSISLLPATSPGLKGCFSIQNAKDTGTINYYCGNLNITGQRPIPVLVYTFNEATKKAECAGGQSMGIRPGQGIHIGLEQSDIRPIWIALRNSMSSTADNIHANLSLQIYDDRDNRVKVVSYGDVLVHCDGNTIGFIGKPIRTN